MKFREAVWWAVNGTNFLDWIAYTLIGALAILLGAQAVFGIFNLVKWIIRG